MAKMNAEENRSRFNLITRNCADFTGGILNFYFPGTFRRSVLPDGGITTPKQISYKLVRYAKKHPETATHGLRHSAGPGESQAQRKEPEHYRGLSYARLCCSVRIHHSVHRGGRGSGLSGVGALSPRSEASAGSDAGFNGTAAIRRLSGCAFPP